MIEKITPYYILNEISEEIIEEANDCPGIELGYDEGLKSVTFFIKRTDGGYNHGPVLYLYDIADDYGSPKDPEIVNKRKEEVKDYLNLMISWL